MLVAIIVGLMIGAALVAIIGSIDMINQLKDKK